MSKKTNVECPEAEEIRGVPRPDGIVVAPEDDPEDLDFPTWSGVVPIHLAAEPSEYRWGRVHEGRVVAP